ncbi:hypothetical protein NEFER03_0828 [Nematocida sp. LUAm3]|nr:hypothetical protein NEFER03_0828 [Nematocida sp. LUAm3]KAI5174846.1 hypothetical protein NEFER02_0946 [Nematocida sp. LUAm2]KAI5177556.1 hypothetical protein NEFER01_0806 [Nematocida sp. LUAm1]
MLSYFSHSDVYELSSIAEKHIVDEICAVDDEETISEYLEDELYALVHFGSAEPQTQGRLKKLDPIETKRYFQVSTVCYQCKKSGHTARDCEENIFFLCTICGGRDHKKNRCAHRVCRICSMSGHAEVVCSRRFYIPLCKRCNSGKHTLSACFTYREGANISFPSHPIKKSCCFCGADGHFLSECREVDGPQDSTFYISPEEYIASTGREAKKYIQKLASQKDKAVKKKEAPHNDPPKKEAESIKKGKPKKKAKEGKNK